MEKKVEKPKIKNPTKLDISERVLPASSETEIQAEVPPQASPIEIRDNVCKLCRKYKLLFGITGGVLLFTLASSVPLSVLLSDSEPENTTFDITDDRMLARGTNKYQFKPTRLPLATTTKKSGSVQTGKPIVVSSTKIIPIDSTKQTTYPIKFSGNRKTTTYRSTMTSTFSFVSRFSEKIVIPTEFLNINDQFRAEYVIIPIVSLGILMIIFFYLWTVFKRKNTSETQSGETSQTVSKPGN